jgi:hypothetical protein
MTPTWTRLPSRRHESEARMNEPWPLKRWPDVPTRVLMCRDNRLFPVDWLHRVITNGCESPPDERSMVVTASP